MSGIEVLRSRRGNPIVYHDGYVYTQHRMTDEKRVFRCESRVGQQSKSKKKIYATLDSRLKRATPSYNFESVNDYLARVAANVKLNS